MCTMRKPGARRGFLQGHAAGIYTVAFQPGFRRFLRPGGFDGNVRLYDVATGQLRKAFVPVPLEKAANEAGSVH